MPAVAAVTAVVDEALRHGEGADGRQADGDLARRLCVTRQVQVRAGRHERLVFTRREHISVTEHLLQFHSRIYAWNNARARDYSVKSEGSAALLQEGPFTETSHFVKRKTIKILLSLLLFLSETQLRRRIYQRVR